ncbi:amidohydrolase family protein [Pseudoxanthomonas sacheonensis]|uniref:amidohydrolase family protein n=1 Tax=Pseudoxanthomonas sacheonensis TaxID=443615 RepID=UPI0013D24545|nr:amidohydrolase family protein [Pseudoxanthomonas sacheonensis]KAF1712850.1 amidohydrolase [Pseudoxanthomonas sacheonensis]
MTTALRALLLCLAAGFLSSPARGGLPESAADNAEPDTYAMADFSRVRKYDAHVHANGKDAAFLEQARADGFELMSINVDYPEFPSLAVQHAAALALSKRDPARFHWATTFSMKGFGAPGWSERVNAGLARDTAQGARAVKIWKNVGMIEKDADGKLIMLDTPALSPVAEQIRALGVALIGHQGEPHNCWLPLERMTTDNDREYFAKHPQYHMYLHPDQPSYEDQIAARDRFVAAHPQLRFVGAHMGSLEYDVDRLAAFLDRFPNADVDLAARMSQVQYQSVRDRQKVRDFFIRYQDRLLYGTDLTFGPDADPAGFKREAHAVWTADWRYLATDETQQVEVLHAQVPGLALPRAVVDKIYYANAARVFAPVKAAR